MDGFALAAPPIEHQQQEEGELFWRGGGTFVENSVNGREPVLVYPPLPLRLPVLQLLTSPLASTSWLSSDCAVCYIFITGKIDGKSHFIMCKMQCSWLSKLHSAGKNLCEALFYISCILCIGWNEKIMKGCILSTFASVWLAALTDLFFKCIYFLQWALLFSILSR